MLDFCHLHGFRIGAVDAPIVGVVAAKEAQAIEMKSMLGRHNKQD